MKEEIRKENDNMDYELEEKNNGMHFYVYGKHGRKISDYHISREQAEKLHRQMSQIIYDMKFNPQKQDDHERDNV